MKVEKTFTATAPAGEEGGVGVSAEGAAPGNQQIVQSSFQISVDNGAVGLDLVGKGSGSVVEGLVTG